MSAARHHADWLSLMEVSGPFLSVPVLLRVFPQGLGAHDPGAYADLRQAFEEWQENQLGSRPEPSLHHAWIRFVLSAFLGFGPEVLVHGQSLPPGLEAHEAEHRETLRPDFAVVNPKGRSEEGKVRLLLQTLPLSQKLEQPLAGKEWKASPATRMQELLRACDVRLGLVTNGEQWMLVHAPRGETSTFASWHASLWFEEQVTLRSFRDLLGVSRFFAVAETDTLEALFAESADNQQEVTEQLGYQVRKAVEVLVQSLDRQDRDRQGKLLSGVRDQEVYEAALTVMMRLVFLFSAEERGLLLLGDDLYDQFYAVSTLRAQLREQADQHGEELLERRHDAWCRLLATFRAVYGGMRHDRLQLPAYGGRLFDPDRYPFLEGRGNDAGWKVSPADPLPINNRTVLHLLEALQMLQVRLPRGGGTEKRRLSFRALDIEQIGHVYEGLLDHSAVRASEPVLGLQGPRDKEEEIRLSELEQHLARGIDEAVRFLKERTSRSENTLRRAITEPPLTDGQRLRVACGNDADVLARVQPFAGLLREDTNGYPIVIPAGSLYVTQTGNRRATGTHYTPRSLTEPIVRYTLEPLVYEGPAEGKPKEKWKLRTAREILDLKVCDMAMGSGAFLVQACRYLSERLVEAWEEVEKKAGGRVVVTPEGDLSTGAPEERPLPADAEERLAIARRIVAERCLYGVDNNSMAVEMAKLSLWLVTLGKNRPFSFLDHALKCGDSLLGVSIEQLQRWSLDPPDGDTTIDYLALEGLDEAIALRKQIEAMADGGVEAEEAKADLHVRAEQALHRMKVAGDLVLTQAFAPSGGRNRGSEYAQRISEFYQRFVADQTAPEEREEILGLLGDNHPFHWPLEFPEVFLDGERGGFDAFVGNPPFLGGQRITGVLGTPYREYLVRHLGRALRGSADLCAFFFLRAHALLRENGVFGMLATNTIAQGDTREVGLEQIIAAGGRIVRADPGRRWPGSANLSIAEIWLNQGSWKGECLIETKDGPRSVPGVTAFLSEPGTVQGTAHPLKMNSDRSFIGSYVLGMGFILDPQEAMGLIDRDVRNKDVLLPYLVGEDLNSRPDQSPSRWVINFHDWPLDRSAEGSWATADEDERRLCLQTGRVPVDYPCQVAADYTDCLTIVKESVKPERQLLKRAVRRERWWRFGDRAPALCAALATKEQVLVTCIVTHHLAFSFQPSGQVFGHKLVVFPNEECGLFAVLQSTLHEAWARFYSSQLETRLNYSPSDCFENYPFPFWMSSLDPAGQRYYQHRQQIMLCRQEGLTSTYNRFHAIEEVAEDIGELRRLRAEMDQAVAGAYGWTDLDLRHGFHETRQGIRFTISESARREVLDRLLLLNHQRHAEEEEAAKNAPGGAKKRTSATRKKHTKPAGPNLGLDE